MAGTKAKRPGANISPARLLCVRPSDWPCVRRHLAPLGRQSWVKLSPAGFEVREQYARGCQVSVGHLGPDF